MQDEPLTVAAGHDCGAGIAVARYGCPAHDSNGAALLPALLIVCIEWIRATLPPGTATDDLQPYHPAIDRYVLIEAGRLRVVVGAAPYLLEEGAAFYFRADVPHRFENGGSGPCCCLAVLDYAPRG